LTWHCFSHSSLTTDNFFFYMALLFPLLTTDRFCLTWHCCSHSSLTTHNFV
jgi:hypothetical protein